MKDHVKAYIQRFLPLDVWDRESFGYGEMKPQVREEVTERLVGYALEEEAKISSSCPPKVREWWEKIRFDKILKGCCTDLEIMICGLKLPKETRRKMALALGADASRVITPEEKQQEKDEAAEALRQRQIALDSLVARLPLDRKATFSRADLSNVTPENVWSIEEKVIAVYLGGVTSNTYSEHDGDGGVSTYDFGNINYGAWYFRPEVKAKLDKLTAEEIKKLDVKLI